LSLYPPKIQQCVASAFNAKTLESPDAVATEASFVCGSFISLSLKIDREAGEIVDAKYRTNGCGFMVAAAEVLADDLISRRLQDLHGADPEELAAVLSAKLGPFPENRSHCASVAIDALRKALGDYRRELIDEYRGERALICTCFGIDEDAIESCIREKGLTDVDEVTQHCRAGSGCGSCQPIIQEIIDCVSR
jgi:NifU-like protein